MMKPLLLAILLLSAGLARADETSHRKAAEEALVAMNIPGVVQKSIDLQVEAMRTNPMMAAHADAFKTYCLKHLGWDALKDAYVATYAGEFTEEELKAITAFYQTPVGKKMASASPGLETKISKLLQERLQASMLDLQKTMFGEGDRGTTVSSPEAKIALPPASGTVEPEPEPDKR